MIIERVRCCGVVLLLLLSLVGDGGAARRFAGPEQDAESRVKALIEASGAEQVAVAFYDLQSGAEVTINADADFHAASTMKVPVMMEVFRQAQAGDGRLNLDEKVRVRNEFRSIVDGSAYRLSASDDSEQSLYRRIGRGVRLRELVRLMITESSNLATNMLIERVGPERVMALLRELGANRMRVLRGVEDGKAFERGLNNTTTARDLMIVLREIAAGRAVSPRAAAAMIDILDGQKFKEGIPAGLPPKIRVAHKTGSITKIRHDAGIIYPPNRAQPYVLVVLTRGLEDGRRADRLIASISKVIYESLR